VNDLATKFEDLSAEISELEKELNTLKINLDNKKLDRENVAKKLKELIGCNIPERHIKSKYNNIVRVNAQGVKVLEVE
jgi:hypothetical protein